MKTPPALEPLRPWQAPVVGKVTLHIADFFWSVIGGGPGVNISIQDGPPVRVLLKCEECGTSAGCDATGPGREKTVVVEHPPDCTIGRRCAHLAAAPFN